MKLSFGADFQQNPAYNLVLQPLSSAPSAPKLGQAYFNTASNVGFVWNGTIWRPMDAAALTDASIAIAALAVNPLLRQNHTGTQTASTISDLSTVVRSYTLDTFAAPVAAVSWNSQRLTGLANASGNTDAVPLGQMTSAIAAAVAGQTAVKNPVRVLAASNITLSGLQTIDGVSLAAGDRVLPIAQTTASQNVIYIAASGAWTVATDNASVGQLIEGTDVLVNEGSTYSGSIWRITTTGTITPGTTSVTWVQTAKANTYTSDGITILQTGMQFSVNYGAGLTVSGGKLVVDTSKVPQKFATTITHDGTTLNFPVTHNLGTTDVRVTVRDSTGAEWIVDNVATSATVATLSWATAQTNGTTFRVIVMG